MVPQNGRLHFIPSRATIGMFLIISGIYRMVFAISERFSGSGWVLLNGAVTLMLGLMIYKQWRHLVFGSLAYLSGSTSRSMAGAGSCWQVP